MTPKDALKIVQLCGSDGAADHSTDLPAELRETYQSLRRAMPYIPGALRDAFTNAERDAFSGNGDTQAADDVEVIAVAIIAAAEPALQKEGDRRKHRSIVADREAEAARTALNDIVGTIGFPPPTRRT